MHQTTAPDRAFLQKMPHGVAQINAAASDNARLVYQPQCAVKQAFSDRIMPKVKVNQPTANSQQPTANSQQPTANYINS